LEENAMSDTDDMLDEGGEPAGGGAKKPAGAGALLPNLLKFVAIGLGAVIFIVTVTAITFNFMNKGGKSQTVTSDSSPSYVGKRPEYLYFNSIGVVRTRTKDVASHSVVVEMGIGYDMNDKNAQTELTTRLYELQDFVRNFFSSKYAEELSTENEARLKTEIIEALNTRVLNSSKAKNIVFKQLDVMEL
jgi:flagellar FliL protein